MSGMLLLRTRDAADDEAIATIISADDTPVSIPFYAAAADEAVLQGTGERWVAVRGDVVIGHAGLDQAWWTRQPDVYFAAIHVAGVERGHGTGSRLMEHMLRRTGELGGRWLQAWLRPDIVAAHRLATRYSFVPTGQEVHSYRLELPKARLDVFGDATGRLRAEDVNVLSLADMSGDRRRLEAARSLSSELQGGWESREESLDLWLENVLRGAGHSGETHWVAWDGERAVGTTYLRRLTDGAANNDFTGVIPSARGRGIAKALKERAVTWGLENGLCTFYTFHDVNNVAMISVNERLGYRRRERRVEVRREL